MIISVGIDVSKDKHDCFIVNSEGEVLADVFTISNSIEGFDYSAARRFRACASPQDKIKVGLEATGHYSYNLLGFLLDNGLATYVLNPLRTNLYRKSLSLRKTKTDRVDARTIAAMLLSDVGLKPYTNTAYHNEELKSLTRYRFDKVKERAKLKSSISRLVCILFPELEKLVSFSPFGDCLRSAGRVSRCQTDCQGTLDKAENTSWKPPPKAATNGIWLLTIRRRCSETLLGPGCLPNPWNCSIPSGSSVNWMLRSLKSKS